jgi:hypothetical protein
VLTVNDKKASVNGDIKVSAIMWERRAVRCKNDGIRERSTLVENRNGNSLGSIFTNDALKTLLRFLYAP